MHKLSGRKIAVVGNVAQNGAPGPRARRQKALDFSKAHFNY